MRPRDDLTQHSPSNGRDQVGLVHTFVIAALLSPDRNLYALHVKIELGGIAFDNLTEAQVVDTVFESLASHEGGRILTPNVDVLRQLRLSPDTALATESSLVVPDGMPIVWASRIQRTPLPERVTGASLVWSLSERAAASGALRPAP